MIGETYLFSLCFLLLEKKMAQENGFNNIINNESSSLRNKSSVFVCEQSDHELV